MLENLSFIAESILQNQVAEILVDLDLDFAGEFIPPVAYHVSALPLALIVSLVMKSEELLIYHSRLD